MKTIVTGSRDWPSYEAIRQALLDYRVTFVVEGGAPGADTFARRAAIVIGIPYDTVHAQWRRYGIRAGGIRNQAMLDKHPDVERVLAFPLKHSIGTWDMIRRAKLRGIKVENLGYQRKARTVTLFD